MEKELQTIPTEKDFNLSKVKLLPKGITDHPDRKGL